MNERCPCGLPASTTHVCPALSPRCACGADANVTHACPLLSPRCSNCGGPSNTWHYCSPSVIHCGTIIIPMMSHTFS